MKFFDPKKKENTPPASQPTPIPVPPPVQATAPPVTPQPKPTPAPVAPAPTPAPSPAPQTRGSQTILGSGVSLKGDVRSDENITIDGTMEGTVESTRDVLIGTEGRLRANIWAANVVIAGKVVGNVTATNRVEIKSTGQLQGNIRSPRLSIAESALFKGSIDMSSPEASFTPIEKEKPKNSSKQAPLESVNK